MSLLCWILLKNTPIHHAITKFQQRFRTYLAKRLSNVIIIQNYWRSSCLYMRILQKKYGIEKARVEILKNIIIDYNQFMQDLNKIINKIIEVFTCPISLHTIDVPIICTDGWMYEYTYLYKYIILQNDSTSICSPVTREILKHEFIHRMKINETNQYSPLSVRIILENCKTLYSKMNQFKAGIYDII